MPVSPSLASRHHRELLQPHGDRALAPDPGGVDEQVVLAIARQHRVDAVPGRARDVRDQVAVLAEEPVDQRRLANVRPADHRHSDRPGDRLVLFDGGINGDLFGSVGADLHRRPFRHGQQLDDHLLEVADVAPVGRADRDGALHAELVELTDQRLLLVAVDLVHRGDHRLAAAAQALGEVAVFGKQACTPVEHEDHHLGFIDGELGLVHHPLHDRVLVLRIEAAGVDQDHRHVDPRPGHLRLGVEAVPGHPGLVGHDRAVAPGQPVEQRRLADVGSTDDRDDRSMVAHDRPSPP